MSTASADTCDKKGPADLYVSHTDFDAGRYTPQPCGRHAKGVSTPQTRAASAAMAKLAKEKGFEVKTSTGGSSPSEGTSQSKKKEGPAPIPAPVPIPVPVFEPKLSAQQIKNDKLENQQVANDAASLTRIEHDRKQKEYDECIAHNRRVFDKTTIKGTSGTTTDENGKVTVGVPTFDESKLIIFCETP